MRRLIKIIDRFLENTIGYALDSILRRMEITALNDDAEASLQQMEYQGFVSYEDFLQLTSSAPQAYIVAGEILGIDSFEVLRKIREKEITDSNFIPALRKGLKNFYKDHK